jgi:hypothetical protein
VENYTQHWKDKSLAAIRASLGVSGGDRHAG